MYQYNQADQRLVDERVEQFRDQVARRLRNELSEDEFRPLRLMNGLYLQRHAYMLRVAVPYGLLSVRQMRMLATIAREHDRGWGHFTTRQNIQYNWPRLAETPEILAKLASVEMHAIQTSGNCIRNISADHLAGVAGDELEDPRPYAEILRQWSTFHPEFSYLPRKFKIAFTGATTDRAAVAIHDIGFRIVKNEAGELGLEVIAGGGLGRTPIIGPVIREFLPFEDMCSYSEAILRVYNLHGDRDNKFKARIKILVKRLGREEFARQVEAEWEQIKDEPGLKLKPEQIEAMRAAFRPPTWRDDAAAPEVVAAYKAQHPGFRRWHKHNVSAHRKAGYNVVTISLKSLSRPPGDITADQMDAVASLAERFSLGEITATHEQNLVLGHVADAELFEVWRELEAHDLATPNAGLLTDLICCPGLDFCALANSGSIGVAGALTRRFADLDLLETLGELKIKMSGCINACGHHHVGHIGILGINKNGEEFYQVMLGGSASDDASLGQWLGPALPQARVVDAIERIVHTYLERREGGERFLDAYRRLGPEPFKEAVYGAA